MTIGSTIETKRKLKGWSQAKLAKKLGCTDAAVSMWESDLTIPRVSRLRKIASALGLSHDELLSLLPASTVKSVAARAAAAAKKEAA